MDHGGKAGDYSPGDCQLTTLTDFRDCLGLHLNVDLYVSDASPLSAYVPLAASKGCVGPEYNLHLGHNTTTSECAGQCSRTPGCMAFQLNTTRLPPAGTDVPGDCQLQTIPRLNEGGVVLPKEGQGSSDGGLEVGLEQCPVQGNLRQYVRDVTGYCPGSLGAGNDVPGFEMQVLFCVARGWPACSRWPCGFSFVGAMSGGGRRHLRCRREGGAFWCRTGRKWSRPGICANRGATSCRPHIAKALHGKTKVCV